MKTYFVYILLCSDNSYYIGITNNLERRIEEHQQGIEPNCYTFSRRPVELKFYAIFNNPIDAIRIEKQVKGWSRKKKEALIESNWERIKELSVCQNNSHYINYISPSFDPTAPPLGRCYRSR